MEPNYLVLLGIVIVIIGFALKLDAILIIIVAAVATALVGGIGVDGFLTTLGTSFVSNRSMAIFIIVLLVTGTLERNGLKIAAAQLIGMASGMENIAWFFGQVLFVGTAGALLVQSTLKPLGYDVELLRMAIIEIPVAVIAVAVTAVYYIIKDARLRKKYYGAPATPALAADTVAVNGKEA